MIKKHRTFALSLILLLSLFISVRDVSAEETKVFECSKETYQKVVDRLDFVYDQSGKITLKNRDSNSFIVVSIKEIDEAPNGEFTGEEQEKRKYLKTTTEEIAGKNFNNKNTLVLELHNLDSKTTAAAKVIDLELVLKESVKVDSGTSYCRGKDDETADNKALSVHYYMPIINPTDVKITNKKENEHYDKLCTVLRTGKNYEGKISEDILKYWEGTPEAQNSYNEFFQYCTMQKVDFNYEEKTVVKAIELAIYNYHIRSTIANTSYSNSIDKTDSAFQSAFSKSQEAAKKLGGEYYQEKIDRTETSQIQTSKLKCAYNKVKDEKNITYEENANGEYYKTESGEYKKIENLKKFTGTRYKQKYQYVNKTSFYASTETTREYEYKTTSEGKTAKISDACVRTCEEAVDVEYGPPVAAKGGMCIEYQVKVTSRVKCDSELKIGAPREVTELCQPVAYCTHSWGFVSDQAGPNEDFDECVEKCDGGKYSESCSKKCYKQVYGNEKLSLSTAPANVQKLAKVSENTDFDYEGKDSSAYNEKLGNVPRYYWNGEEIKWQPSGTYANYYIDKVEEKTIKDDKYKSGGKYVADAEGFKRKSTTSYRCPGTCRNIGCYKSSDYIYGGDVDKDYYYNLQNYETVLNECKEAATCTTKTATFTMTADVHYNNGKVDTINYPATEKTSNLESTNKEHSEFIDKETGVIISYNGCYREEEEKDIYQAEWTFDATWRNIKDGSISFTPKTGDDYQVKTGKFCIPVSYQDSSKVNNGIANINVAWWKAYNKTIIDNTYSSYDGKTYSETTETSKDKNLISPKDCKQCYVIDYTTNDYQVEPKGDYTSDDANKRIGWNIGGKTVNFGYFGWTFDIRCFYALYNGDGTELGEEIKADGTTTGTRVDCGSDKCSTSPQNKETRTVALTDMFPSQSGTATNDKTSTGRQAGFNWTSKATISEKAPKEYQVNPEKLIEKIQKNANEIYSVSREEEFLDYEFNLTPSNLRAIKDVNKKQGGVYTNWYGTQKASTENYVGNVYIYRSGLFRSTGGYTQILTGSSVKKTGLLGCNNQASENECDYSLLKGE